MNKHLPIIIAAILGLAATSLSANETLWTDIQTRQATDSPIQQRSLALNEAGLQSLLINSGAEPTLSLPLPTGGFAKVQLAPVETLSPTIAAQFPDWKTWQIKGLDGQVTSGRAELTALGFTAMLVMHNGDTLFIDPTTATTQVAGRSYRSLSKQTNSGLFKNHFQCATHNPAASEPPTADSMPKVAARAGEDLKTYDIAIAATGEYTKYHGGSKTAALSAITTTINRMNEVYQRDLSIKLRLVSGVTTIYTDATTDPYPSSGSTLLSENQTVLDNFIGSENYDVGHLFTTGDGGVAVVEGACRNAYKGQGVSGWDTPTGDIFAIDYVAHEVGHQFGATHTFNSNSGSCSGNNRIPKTAYEPGSGSTIMSYAGICSPDNVQAHSDAMFHSGSISQITTYTQNSTGATCADSSSLTNANPVANAGKDYTIPARTPFILTGSATDSNNDALSYSWEEIDLGAISKVDVDTGDNALVRTQLPSSSPSRTIPRLADLLSNSHTYGETLSSQTRPMNFRLQVRDGKGGISSDDMLVSVHDTGSTFAITSPQNTPLVAGSSLNVKWNTAKTEQAPIACSTVDIALNMTSTTTNENFQTLLSGTANDGDATVTLPSTLGTKNTIRVKCSNNIFFALSDANPTSAGNGGDSGGVFTNGGTGSLPIEFLFLIGFGALLRQRFASKGSQV